MKSFTMAKSKSYASPFLAIGDGQWVVIGYCFAQRTMTGGVISVVVLDRRCSLDGFVVYLNDLQVHIRQSGSVHPMPFVFDSMDDLDAALVILAEAMMGLE